MLFCLFFEIEVKLLQVLYYNPFTLIGSQEDSHWNTKNMVYGDNNSLVPNIRAIRQSSNLYVYAINNPILYVDPSGHIIKVVGYGNGNDDDMWQYYRAIEYLKQSDEFNTMYQRLEDSDEVFTIEFHTGNNGYYDANTRTVIWNPILGGIMGDGVSIQSPAITLAHEMGHAVQYLDGTLEAKAYTRSEKHEIEEDNVAQHETPIAKELGEYWRKNYDDASGFYQMNNSTDWGTRNFNPGGWLNPLNWFRPNDYTNKNKWQPQMYIQ